MAHITHTKPSSFTTFWNFLTFEGNPTKVNCWFCNQDAYLLPGSKQTPTNWYCDLCNNINARDQSGDIIDLSLQYSYNRPDKSHCFQLSPRQPLRSLCDACIENEETIQRLVADYIPDEDDPTFKYRMKTSDEYVESLHVKYPICAECQRKVDAIIKEQIEADRSRNFISRITTSLATKPPKRPSRLSYYIQGLLYFWTHILAIATLLYGYYFVPNLQYAPTNWIQLDTIYSTLDALLEPFKSPSSLEKMHHLLTHTGQHLVGFFYNTYLITYKVALRAMESKRVMTLHDWELEDHAFGFFVANMMSFAIIDWHPVTINVFVEEPGRVKHWQAYKVIQRLLYVARVGSLFLINHASDNLWIKIVLIIYLTFWLLSLLMVRSSKPNRVIRVPTMKPLGNAINQAFCGAYQACKGKAVWIKENIRFKWRTNKEIRDQYEQDMDIDPIGEGQDASEEEVEQVATKMDDIRL